MRVTEVVEVGPLPRAGSFLSRLSAVASLCANLLGAVHRLALRLFLWYSDATFHSSSLSRSGSRSHSTTRNKLSKEFVVAKWPSLSYIGRGVRISRGLSVRLARA